MGASGCSGQGTAQPASTTNTSAASESAWQRTLDQVKPDGSVGLSTALAAFALAVGPIPGAAPPSGPAQVIPSGTLAVNWVLANWGQLTADQQRAVLADLGTGSASTAPAAAHIPPAGRGAGQGPAGVNAVAAAYAGSGTSREADAQLAATAPSPGPNPDTPCLTTDSARAAPYRAQLAGITADISAHLGRPLTLAVHFSVNNTQLQGTSRMYTYACESPTAPNGPITGCTIHVNPNALNVGYTDSDRHAFLIHELMHCYLYDKFGFDYNAMPSWYVEGVPTWVMTVLGPGDPVSSAHWVDYVDQPTTPLFARKYDAVGFYAHLAETGADVWKVIDPIGAALRANGNSSAAGWNAAGVTQALLDSWGSGYATGRYPGQAWNTGGPNLPHYTEAITQGSLNDGGAPVALASPAAATAIEQVDVNAQVVQVVPGPGASGRLSVDHGSDAVLSATGGVRYCTLGSACVCPAGSPGQGATFTPLSSGEHYLTVTGGLAAASVKLTGMSLANSCAQPLALPCIIGSWTGTGLTAQGGLTADTGGAGARLHLDSAGNLTIVFTGMQPVTFTGSSAGVSLAGTFVYSGTETAVVTIPAAGATTGVLEGHPGTISVGGVDVTVRITSPVKTTVGPMSVSQYASSAGAGSGNGISSTPLNGGTWQCQGNTMTLTERPGASTTGIWAFTRTGPA
jgi:hypothetical protein